MTKETLSDKILRRIIYEASTPEKDEAMWLDRKRTRKAIEKDVKEFDLSNARKRIETIKKLKKKDKRRIKSTAKVRKRR